MARCKITTLSPVHIGSGDEYELNYNMLYKDNFVYIYDEFKIVEFFILKNIEIPSKIETLKETIQEFQNEIIASNLHKRKIYSLFGQITKPILEEVSTQNQPIITGSSIKGAIRTAYLFKMVKNGEFKKEQNDLMKIEAEIQEENDESKKKYLEKDKRRLVNQIDKTISYKTKSIFRDLKISDTYSSLSTQVFKSINIKKEKSHQLSRTEKVNKIATFVEAIPVGKSSEITINILSDYFNNIKSVCNSFYQIGFEKEFNNYFLDKSDFSKFNLRENQFLLNIGRFAGSELKSIEEIRNLPRTGAKVNTKTSARTFALKKDIEDETYFENSLLPFGWLLCEILD